MIYITGSSGFLGKYLVAHLKREKINFERICFRNIVKNKKINYRILNALFKNKNIILIHLAWGWMSEPNSSNHVSNFKNSKILFNFSLKNNFRKVIFLGSINEYGSSHLGPLDEKAKTKNIDTEYGRKKLKVTKYGLNLFKNSNTEFYSLRSSYIYGPFQRSGTLIDQIFKNLKSKKILRLSKCLGYRDYVYVGDVVRAIMAIVLNNNKKIEQGIYNIGSGKCIMIKYFILKILKKLKFKKNLIKFGALPERKEQKQNAFFLVNKKLKNNFRFKKVVDINHGINLIIKERKLT